MSLSPKVTANSLSRFDKLWGVTLPLSAKAAYCGSVRQSFGSPISYAVKPR